MKKLIAIISALTMAVSVMCIGASAASTPSIKVFGNDSTPAEKGKETSFNVRLADFNGIKGMDVKITSDSNAKFTGITSEDIKLTKDDNYKLSDNEIHIVELNTKDTLLLKVKATVSAEAKITVSATLAESGTTLAQSVATVGGTVSVSDKKEDTTKAEATVLNPSGENYFIPYGYVKRDGKYIEKEADGSFKNVPAGQNYAEFPIPADVVTFGVSEKENTTNTPQFGSYGVKVADKTFGTLSVIGDWDGFSAYYVKNYGVTISELMKAVLNYYNANEQAMKDANATHVIFKYGEGKTKSIKIFKTAQTKVMWENTEHIQYSLRVEGLTAGDQVAAVGYSVNNGKTVLSSEIKTYTAQ